MPLNTVFQTMSGCTFLYSALVVETKFDHIASSNYKVFALQDDEMDGNCSASYYMSL